jgi:hypothetical protein
LIRLIRGAKGMPWWAHTLVAAGGFSGLTGLIIALAGPVQSGLEYLSQHPQAVLVLACTALVLLVVGGLGVVVWTLWGTTVALRLRIESIQDERIQERGEQAGERMEIDREMIATLASLRVGIDGMGTRIDHLTQHVDTLKSDVRTLINEKRPDDASQVITDAIQSVRAGGDPALERITEPFPPTPENDPRFAVTRKQIFRTPLPR